MTKFNLLHYTSRFLNCTYIYSFSFLLFTLFFVKLIVTTLWYVSSFNVYTYLYPSRSIHKYVNFLLLSNEYLFFYLNYTIFKYYNTFLLFLNYSTNEEWYLFYVQCHIFNVVFPYIVFILFLNNIPKIIVFKIRRDRFLKKFTLKAKQKKKYQ